MLSVIIPVHNSEKYLKRCVESVVGQTYQDLEIILIDDGSTDSSKMICEFYKRNDDRIRFFCENKRNAAKIRNIGLKISKGDYITFVDSDDYLREDAYEILIDKIQKNRADMACCSFYYIDEEEKPLKWYTPQLNRYCKNECYSGIDAANIFLTSRDIEGFGWNKVFKRKMVIDNKIVFDESKTAYEDMVAMFKATLYSERVTFVPEQLYYYRQLGTSLTHNLNKDRYEEYTDSINQIAREANKNGLILESEVFIIIRDYMVLYDAMKNKQNAKCIMDRKTKGLRDVNMLLKYNRSERIRTVFKAMIVNLCAR